MRNYLLVLIVLLIPVAALAQNGNKIMKKAGKEGLYMIESRFRVNETVVQIEKDLKEANIPVFAKFDHAKNAKEAGLAMRPTRVIVFGSPKVGTGLMLDNQRIAIELPLRIAVLEDEKGVVWIVFPVMERIAARYGVEAGPVVAGMQGLLENMAKKAAGTL